MKRISKLKPTILKSGRKKIIKAQKQPLKDTRN